MVPLYWFALVVLYVVDRRTVNGFGPKSVGIDFGGLRSTLELFSFTHIYDAKHFFSGIPAAYTLDVEMSFYVFVAFYAIVMLRRARRADTSRKVLQVELVGLAALWLISEVWRILMLTALRPAGVSCSGTQSHWTCAATNWLPGFLDYFIIGMVLAVVVAHGGRQRITRGIDRSSFGVAPYLAAVAVWLVYQRWFGTYALESLTGWRAEVRHHLNALMAVLLVAPAALVGARSTAMAKVLGARVLRWLAVLSYGFYLWHQGALDAMLRITNKGPFNGSFVRVAPAAVALALVIAWCSWWLIERPAAVLRTRLLNGFNKQNDGDQQHRAAR